MNASYGGSRGGPDQMTLGGMKNNNGPMGNDLYIINPSSPKNVPTPIYNHNSYVTSPRTPASTAAAMGGFQGGNDSLLV